MFYAFAANLTYFWPMFPFCTSSKNQKTFVFLVFSGGIKWEHWPEMVRLPKNSLLKVNYWSDKVSWIAHMKKFTVALKSNKKFIQLNKELCKMSPNLHDRFPHVYSIRNSLINATQNARENLNSFRTTILFIYSANAKCLINCHLKKKKNKYFQVARKNNKKTIFIPLFTLVLST